MKQEFSDRASFLKAMTPLRDASFYGSELVHDKASGTFTLTLTRADASRGGGFLSSRKTFYIKTLVTVRRITSYTQYLVGPAEDVYVLDRAEVGRGGLELSFYFRPGDRAVMDVEHIEGVVEDTGRVTSAPRQPVIQNPLLKEEKVEKQAAKKKTSAVERILGKPGRKPR